MDNRTPHLARTHLVTDAPNISHSGRGYQRLHIATMDHANYSNTHGKQSDLALLPTPLLNQPTRITPKGSKQSGNSWDLSVVIVGAVVLIGDSSRGVLFPVMWELCSELGGDLASLGYLVALFSAGRFLVTVPFGYVCDKYRHRFILIIANAILAAGAVLWANAYSVRSLWVLYCAQVLLGCGSGSLGVTRSFFVEQVPPSRRMEVLGVMTAVQYAGFTVSPVVGSLLSFLGDGLTGEASAHAGSSYLKYALPAYAIGAGALACLLMLTFFFKDIRHENKPTASSNHTTGGAVASTGSYDGIECGRGKVVTGFALGRGSSPSPSALDSIQAPGPDPAPVPECIQSSTPSSSYQVHEKGVPRQSSAPIPAILKASGSSSNDEINLPLLMVALMVLNFTTKGSLAVYETLGAMMATLSYQMDALSKALLVTLSGAVGCLQLIFMKRLWTSRFSDTQLMSIGLVFMIIAQLLMYTCNSGSADSAVTGGTVADYNTTANGHDHPSVYQFGLSVVLMYSIGYPLGHTAVLGAFSKLQRAGPQAALLGGFAAVGSLARVVLPVLGSPAGEQRG